MPDLMQGKRGLVMGVANDRSIAWGIARAMAAVKDEWGTLDFVVHAIAFSDKTELTGRFTNTTRANFLNSLNISCFSFIDIARRAAPLMPQGGCLLTLTYQGSNRVTPYYNVMGVAKAALESSVRYLANDLGPDGIRVNAISPGPRRLPVPRSAAHARPSAIPRPTPPCAPTPRWRRSAARPSTWPRTGAAAPRARRSLSTAAIMFSACRSPKRCSAADGSSAGSYPKRGHGRPRNRTQPITRGAVASPVALSGQQPGFLPRRPVPMASPRS